MVNAAPGRANLRDRELAALQDGVAHRYLHLIDGGLSDNVGLRTVLEGLEVAMASEQFRAVTGFDKLKRFAVVAVPAALIDTDLKALGFTVTEGIGKTGVVEVLKCGPGPTRCRRGS